LTTGGGLKCWGYDGDGELGDGNAGYRSAPVDVVGFEGAPIPEGGTPGVPAGASAGTAGAPTGASGWSAGGYAAMAGGLTAAVVLIGVGVWYARRRQVR
jgi:hypothetical protein